MPISRCTFRCMFLLPLFIWTGLTMSLSAAEAASVRTIILSPVVFEDMPVDRYEQKIAEELFLNAALEELRKKGYKVKSVSSGAADSLQESARSHAGDADALAVVRIDHYLDAGFGEDTRMASFLQVYASARIYATESGELLWRGEGGGTSNRNISGVSSTRLEISLTADEVVRDIFRSLPPPGDWPTP